MIEAKTFVLIFISVLCILPVLSIIGIYVYVYFEKHFPKRFEVFGSEDEFIIFDFFLGGWCRDGSLEDGKILEFVKKSAANWLAKQWNRRNKMWESRLAKGTKFVLGENHDITIYCKDMVVDVISFEHRFGLETQLQS